ncbi:polysaccharide biosynthesis C-terminal domain-containing protein [Rhodococcus kroppenstedtii]|nr:polysaccharide biosynthesis C-terminal domain-containing protein [Rhodococcus kroppenstedtii]
MADRGEVAAATAPLLLVIAAATFGLPEAVTYYTARHSALRRRVLRHGMLLISLAAIVGVLLNYILIVQTVSVDGAARAPALLALPAVLPGLLIGLLRGSAAGQGEWHSVTIEKLVSSLARLITLTALLATGSLTVLTAVLVIAYAPVLGGLAYLRPKVYKPVTPDQGYRVESLVVYGSRVWLGSVAGVLLARIDQVLMNPLAGAVQLGLYVVAVSISEVPLIVNAAIRDVLFTEQSSGDSADRLAQAGRLSTLFVLIICVLLGVSVPFWLPIVFGNEFTDAVGPTLLLLVAVAIGNPGSMAGAGLSGRGRPGLRSWAIVVACAANILLVILLVPIYGAMGAAAATLLANIVSSNLNLLFAKKVMRIRHRDFWMIRRNDVRVVFTVGRDAICRLTRR